MRTVLSVAGSDPTGGAGIQADLKTFARFGVRGLTVLTALTAQDADGVRAVFPLEGAVVAAQIDSLSRGFRIDAVKVGMLCTAGAARALGAWLDRWKGGAVVVDPILASGTGVEMLDPEGLGVLRAEIVPRATLLTPNLDEAARLAGMKVEDVESMEEAARRLHAMGAAAVLVKGGHLAGAAVDVLFDGERTARWEEERVPGRIHGAGCALSSAIAAALGRGDDLTRAIGRAKRYVGRAIARGTVPANGAPLHLDHQAEID